MKEYPLVQLGTLISQAKTVRCGEADYPVLSMTMHNGLVFQDEKFKKVIASKDRSNYKVVCRNQLVISFPIDEGVLAAQRITDIGIVSPAYGIWDIDQEKVLPEFLEYALRCERALHYYKSKLRGSTARRRSLPTPTLLAFTIPLPSIDEQLHILEIVHKVKDVIDKREKEINYLDELVKARFIEFFGDPVKNIYNYPEHMLGDIVEFLTSGSRGWAKYYSKKGKMFITIKNVKDGQISTNNIQYITPPDNAEARRTKVQNGDLLISITADLGRTAVVPKEIAEKGAYINQHLMCVRLNKKVLLPEYVSFFMESEAGKRQFYAKNQNAVKAGLNFDAIKTFKIMVPPLEKQNEYISFTKCVNKSKVAIQKSLDETQILFQSLMQKYFG